jgi:hypothetical protein
MASFLAIGAGGAGILAFLETKFAPKFTSASSSSSTSSNSNSNSNNGLNNPLFFITPLILSSVGIFIFTQGMAVGQARKKFMELAKRDGEKDVEERYDLPNLYAQGTSPHARAFNAVQRSHQHIFENFSTMMLTGCTAALSFPIASAVSCALYAVGRVIISKNYERSDGDAQKRYSNKLGMSMWFGLLFSLWLAPFSCIKMLSTAELA